MNTDAVCPHCALLCDDLRLEERVDLSFKVGRTACPRAAAAYAKPPIATQALSNGIAVDLDTAIDEAARLLKRSRRPLFAGLGTDVDGMRACVDLAERCNGTLDHLHGDTLARMNRVLQSRGWYATTLSELRNRADLVVLVDAELGDRFDKFRQRCLTPRVAMNGNVERHVAFVGAKRHLPKNWTPDSQVTCSSDGLVETLRSLHAALRGTSPAGARPTAQLERVATLAERIKAARYCTFVFTPSSLAEACESVAAALGALVDTLNRTGRAAILSLGGDDGAQSAATTCTWLTGYPLRVALGRTVTYEPRAYATSHLLNSDAIDALVWIDAFGRHPSPPREAPRDATIVLGCSTPRDVRHAALFIPVGTPGVDHRARLVRTDSVVTLALPQQRDSGLHSAAGILSRVRDRLG